VRPLKKSSVRTIVSIWLAWSLIVIGFQALATARLQPQWPDRAQDWVETFTGPNYQKGHPYLLDPFMNDQVAWDSEYYLGIAVGGYNDLQVTHLPVQDPSSAKPPLSLSYAFLPLYPFLIRLLAFPLRLFGMDPIATATLAGVIVSALGALGGMLALYDLSHEKLGEDGALRAVFYLIIFPTGFFLIQVYTEGLFAGLAFGCLALLKRRKWLGAAVLGACATLTRAVGVALVIPMAIAWIRTGEWLDLDREYREILLHGIPLRPLARGLLAFAPAIAFLAWKFSILGFNFDVVETDYFGRGFINFGAAFYNWATAFHNMFIGHPQETAYFLTEFIGLFVGGLTSILCLRLDPEIAWFSLAVFLISLGSGPAQGIQRYILGAPAVFLMLARWGKHTAFDRAWTISSLLLMGMSAMLFAFNMWVA